PTEKIVWWSEGIAEYVAQENDNQAALETILDGSTYTLSEIFETTYDGFDVDRIYRWGYLAVRFMFENHKDDVNQMLVETRQGNWSNYKATITQWANLYQSEFEPW
ncbi:collagenase, partial [Vibrio parahaemolyticus]|uniref:collagenase n=1 Tax=Vibrio parahaemolyticus TaxID=670 RepID=UPI00146F1D52